MALFEDATLFRLGMLLMALFEDATLFRLGMLLMALFEDAICNSLMISSCLRIISRYFRELATCCCNSMTNSC
jgi:hypothetical protein